VSQTAAWQTVLPCSQVRLALERISKRERIKLQLAKTHAQLAEVTPQLRLAASGPS
jgi:hypothetical protein